MKGIYSLLANLLYGTGMRIMQCVHLRVNQYAVLGKELDSLPTQQINLQVLKQKLDQREKLGFIRKQHI